MKKLLALYQFSRPHTILATSLQALGIFAIVIAGQPLSTAAVSVLALAWVGSLATNLFVVGLNQLTDVEIDRVNKPGLPLASGAFSRREGIWIVVVAGALALAIGASQSGFLLLTFCLIMLIGAGYSLSPVRLKHRPLWAALSIALARGVIANLGLYRYYTAALGMEAEGLPILLAWILLFFFGFGLVIAIYKDIPDWAGDRQFAVRTYAVRLGRQRVFNLGRWLLTAIYLIPIAAGILFLPAPAGMLLAAPHLIGVALFWVLSLRTDPARPPSMMRLYLFLWALFYAEYLILIVYSALMV